MDEFKYLTWKEEEAVGVISTQNINLRRTYCNFFIKRRIECGEDFRKLLGEVVRRTDSYYGSITIMNIMYF